MYRRGLRPVPIAVALTAFLGSACPASAGTIHYAARTDTAGAGPNADYFSVIEDEQVFLVVHGSGARGPAASKHVAEAFGDFYKNTVDVEATWPHRQDVKLSWIENRIVGALQAANERLFARGGERATAVAVLVSGDKLTVAHVGFDRAYLVRDGHLQRLTRDHTFAEDYRRDHPDVTEDDLRALPRKDVLVRAFGRRPTADVDVATSELQMGDRVLLVSTGVALVLSDAQLEQIATAVGLETKDMEDLVRSMVARAMLSGTGNFTVMALSFVNKQPKPQP